MKDPFLPLTHPNPLILSQEKWDRGKITLYNMGWQSVVINPDSRFDDGDHEILEEIRQEPEVVLPLAAELPKVKIPETPKVKDAFLEERVVIFHCLPATIENQKDNLYGDSYQKVVYGDKFKFEGVMIKEDEYFCSFWAKVDKLNVGSIVYPSMYRNGRKYNAFRWWKVMQSEEKNGGFIASCTISDHQPHFAD